jgi:Dolichyl-phosphate-mannose-protein mannosyltransferase
MSTDAPGTPPAGARAPRWPRLLAAGALAFALLTGSVSLGWGLPYIWHPDEKVGTAVQMLRRHSLDPQYFINPHLHLYAVAAAVWTAEQIWPGRIQLDLPAIVPLTDPANPDRPVQFAANLAARGVSVLFAVCAVWWLWRSLRRPLGEPAAALAAAGLSVSMGLMNVAHFATPETLLVLLTVATLAALATLGRSHRVRDALVAGAVFGLACSTKYTAVLLAGPLIWVSVDVARRAGIARAARLALLVSLAAVVAFFAGSPYALLHWRQFVSDGLVFTWGTGVPTDSLLAQPRSWWAYAGHLADAMGPVLFAASLAGLAGFLTARRTGGEDRRTVALHVVWAAVFFGFLGLSPHHAMRFILPIVPSLAVVGGWAAARLLAGARTRTSRRLTAGLVAAVLAYSAAYCVEGAWWFAHDPRYEAGQWLADHLAPGVGVSYFAIESYLPFFDRPAYSITFHDEVWQPRLRGAAFDAWRARTLPGLNDVVVDANFFYQRYLDDPPAWPGRVRLYRELLDGTDAEGYREVARFRQQSPWWLFPHLELAAPDVVVFARPGQTAAQGR